MRFSAGVILLAFIAVSYATVAQVESAVGIYQCNSRNCFSPYVCDSNNRCINPLRCPGNSTFQRCASTCRPTCTNPYPQACTKDCYLGCVCNNGYVLDSRNNCILLSDCPYNGGNSSNHCPSLILPTLPYPCRYEYTIDSSGCRVAHVVCNQNNSSSTVCGPNSYYTNCTSYCPTIHCGNLYQQIVCYSLTCAPPGCVCNQNYVFRSEDKSQGCVLRNQCSSNNNTFPWYPGQGGWGNTSWPGYPGQGGIWGNITITWPGGNITWGNTSWPNYPGQGGWGNTTWPIYPGQGGWGNTTWPIYPGQGGWGNTTWPIYPGQGGWGNTTWPIYPGQGGWGNTTWPTYPGQGGWNNGTVNRQCGQNEVFTSCGTACEPTCENPRPQYCTLQCVVNVCQCRSGYVRHRTRGCILPSQCYA